MLDGTTHNCDYNKAAKILEILKGEKKPDNEKQAIFASQVAKVEFDQLSTNTHLNVRRAKLEHDEKMDKILNDPNLYGHKRAMSVIKRLKERTK